MRPVGSGPGPTLPTVPGRAQPVRWGKSHRFRRAGRSGCPAAAWPWKKTRVRGLTSGAAAF